MKAFIYEWNILASSIPNTEYVEKLVPGMVTEMTVCVFRSIREEEYFPYQNLKSGACLMKKDRILLT